jgi:hypothetical protein
MKKQNSKRAGSRAETQMRPPPEIIEICERPGYLDHLQNSTFRVTVEVFDETSRPSGWRKLTSDTGNELWLLEYPPHSQMVYYCLQGVPLSAIRQAAKKGEDDEIPF